MCVCACEQNQLRDRSVIQLYSKAAGVYLGLRVSGQVVAMTNPDNDASKSLVLSSDKPLVFLFLSFILKV